MAKTKKAVGQTSSEGGLKVISYRIDKDTFHQLERMAAEERDEAGLPLNASTFARRLMRESLQLRKKRSKE